MGGNMKHISLDLKKIDKIKLGNNSYYDHNEGIIKIGEEKQKLTDGLNKTLLKLVENNGEYIHVDQLYKAYCKNSNGDNEGKCDIPTLVKSMITRLNKMLKSLSTSDKGFISCMNEVGYCIELPEQEEFIQENTKIDEFGETLINNTKALLKQLEEERDFATMDTDLLAKCTVQGCEYSSLYDYFRVELRHNIRRNYYIQAVGGSGKSTSLYYTCKRLINDNDSKDHIIPVFIRMAKLDLTLEKPILTYIYNNYVEKMDFGRPGEQQEQFFHNLAQYLKNSNKKMILILDGCNETGDNNSLNGINDILDMPNTRIIISSRLDDKVLKDFLRIKLHHLDKSAAKRFLENYNITMERRYYSETLMLPIFVRMYKEIYGEEARSRRINVDSLTQAEIIRRWVNRDIEENYRLYDDEARFTVECFLPLLSMVMYFDLPYEKHSLLSVNKENCKAALTKVKNILKDEDFADSIQLEYGWQIDRFNLTKCLNKTAVDRFAFLQRVNNEDCLFIWSHEYYRDWFIARGLYILKKNSEKLSLDHMERFVNDPFKYPEVFKRQDYPTYSIAVFYAEFLGEKILTTEKSIYYHKLLDGIMSVADDIGDVENVLEYSIYLKIRENNKDINTPKFEKAITFSAMAFSLLHIFNLKERKDANRIVETAFNALNTAKKNISELLDYISFDPIFEEIDRKISISPEKSISPQQTEEYYKNMLSYEQFAMVTQLRAKPDLEFDCDTLMACLARLYGNYGQYYLVKSDISGDINMLTEAFKMHFMGGLIKYYNLKNNMEIKDRSVAGAMSVSFKSMGIYFYRRKDYKQSVAYLVFARDNYEISELARAILNACVVRSKTAGIIDGIFEPIPELLDEEIEIITYFKDARVAGELERTIAVVMDMIRIFGAEHDPIVKNKLLKLIEVLNDASDSLSVRDNLGKKMQKLLGKVGMV